ncbi:Dynactin subunit 1 [Varanus komodoensis]|nr:Dynactin subunit 1 [Varanus komodoensis]
MATRRTPVTGLVPGMEAIGQGAPQGPTQHLSGDGGRGMVLMSQLIFCPLFKMKMPQGQTATEVLKINNNKHTDNRLNWHDVLAGGGREAYNSQHCRGVWLAKPGSGRTVSTHARIAARRGQKALLGFVRRPCSRGPCEPLRRAAGGGKTVHFSARPAVGAAAAPAPAISWLAGDKSRTGSHYSSAQPSHSVRLPPVALGGFWPRLPPPARSPLGVPRRRRGCARGNGEGARDGAAGESRWRARWSWLSISSPGFIFCDGGTPALTQPLRLPPGCEESS